MLSLRPGQAFVAGVHLRPALSHSPGFQAGVEVALPMSTLRRMMGIPMDQFVDQVVPLETLSNRLGDQLRDATTVEQRVTILDAAIGQHISTTKPLELRQIAALKLLRHRPELDISDVAFKVGWSRKHLADRVRDVLGVGPRSFRRLVRFQRLTQSLQQGDSSNWAETAAKHGYCDQSHMIREFREFASMAPSEFLKRLLTNGGGLVES